MPVNALPILRATLRLPDDALAQLRQDLRAMPRAIPRIERKAVNAGARAMQREMVKRAAAETGVPARLLRERAWFSAAARHKPQARATAGRIGFPLARFNPVETDDGVTVQVGNAALQFPHAFLARSASGHLGVFQRRSSARLPIDEVRTDAVTDVLLRVGADADIAQHGLNVAVDTIAAEVDKVWRRS